MEYQWEYRTLVAFSCPSRVPSQVVDHDTREDGTSAQASLRTCDPRVNLPEHGLSFRKLEVLYLRRKRPSLSHFALRSRRQQDHPGQLGCPTHLWELEKSFRLHHYAIYSRLGILRCGTNDGYLRDSRILPVRASATTRKWRQLQQAWIYVHLQERQNYLIEREGYVIYVTESASEVWIQSTYRIACNC